MYKIKVILLKETTCKIDKLKANQIGVLKMV